MIRPRSRLLFWVAMVVLPFAIIGTFGPIALIAATIAIGLLLAVTILDAALAFGTHTGINFKLPEVVRLTKGRPGKLELRIQNPNQKSRPLQLGLAFPAGLQTTAEELPVTLPAGSEWSRLEWPCIPVHRGLFRLNAIYFQSASPLGFWDLRASRPVHSEVRVYPNLFTDRKSMAALFLNRGSFGIHAQRQVGKGREFEKLREYIPGDSFDEIHWKATAKRGRPVTKVFQIERTQEIYVVIDASRLSARNILAKVSGTEATDWDNPAANGESTLERYLTAALLLGLAAEQQGDLFGLLTFTDQVQSFLRARSGKAHFHACRDSLFTLQPSSASPDYQEVASFVRLHLRRRALLVFLTALDDPVLAEGFVRSMDLLCRQHLVLVNMIQPPAAAPLFSNPALNSIDDLYSQLGGHIQWQNLRELHRVLHRRGVQFSLLQNEKLSAELVTQYLNIKRRQLI